MRPVGEDGGDEDEAAEGQASRGLRMPGSPSEEARASHARTHIPYRDWCDCCVAGRRQAAAHRSASREGRYSTAQIAADYWFMGGSDDANRESLPVLVFYEKVRKVLYAHAAPAKGANPQITAQLTRDLEDMGLKRAVHKSDQEPAIISLYDALRVEWEGELVPELAPLGDSDSNGAAESAVKQHQGLVRTYKLALRGRIGEDIRDDSIAMQWLIEWAAAMHRRFVVGTDGQTAFQRIRGKTSDLAIVEFGERVLGTELRATAATTLRNARKRAPSWVSTRGRTR